MRETKTERERKKRIDSYRWIKIEKEIDRQIGK